LLPNRKSVLVLAAARETSRQVVPGQALAHPVHTTPALREGQD
jgi:hypothetical protein